MKVPWSMVLLFWIGFTLVQMLVAISVGHWSTSVDVIIGATGALGGLSTVAWFIRDYT